MLNLRCLALVLVMLTGGCTDLTETKIAIVSYGIVENETFETEENSDLVAGEHYWGGPWNLVEQTTKIPNTLGIEFGVEYEVSGPFYKGYLRLQEVVIYPGDGLKNPTTGDTTKIESETVLIELGQRTYFSYVLDEPWEAKSGKWVFQIKRKDAVLAEQAFIVESGLVPAMYRRNMPRRKSLVNVRFITRGFP